MRTTRKSESRGPRKGRPPKCPDNIRKRWSGSLGWRFRAVVTVAGHRHVGRWCETVKEAQDELGKLRDRSGQVESTPELVTVGDACRLFLTRAEERGFQKRKRKPCRPDTVGHYRQIVDMILRESDPEPRD